MGHDVTIFAARFAGLLSFLSPCVLPLVPPYLVYLAGTSLERFAGATYAMTFYVEGFEADGGRSVTTSHSLLISPLVLAGSIEEREYANHFTLLKTLEQMFGVEPLGYAGEEEVPTLSPELFI